MHHKGYTTALPNTVLYDINESTNKCTSGVRGARKQCTNVHSLLFSREKWWRKTGKSQSGLKTANIHQNFVVQMKNLLIKESQKFLVFVCMLFHCFRSPLITPLYHNYTSVYQAGFNNTGHSGLAQVENFWPIWPRQKLCDIFENSQKNYFIYLGRN